MSAWHEVQVHLLACYHHHGQSSHQPRVWHLGTARSSVSTLVPPSLGAQGRKDTSHLFSAVIKFQDNTQLILSLLLYLPISSTQQCPSCRSSSILSGSLNSKNRQTVAWGWGRAKEHSIPVSLQIYHLSWEL